MQTALTTYYAYAYAWLSYGVTLWGNSTGAQTLFTLQKKLVRILVNIEQTDSCKPFFQKHDILTLPCIYILETCKFVRQHEEFYTKREDTQTRYLLRHRSRLNLPSSRLKMHSQSPYVMSIKLYNKLPALIKKEEKNNTFLKKLRIFLLKKSYYSINEYLSDRLIKS